MARPLRLLVVSHDASRTGAPLVLLTFLRWVRANTDAEVQLVLWRGGPLVEDFRAVAEVTVLHPPPGRRSPGEWVEDGLAKVGLGRLAEGLTHARVRRRLRVAPHDVRYLNGAGAALVAAHLEPGPPSIAHVHELERGLTFSLRGPGRDAVLGADRVLTVSRAVADLLVDRWGVDGDRVSVVPGCVPDRPDAAVAPGRSTVLPGDLPVDVPLVLSVGAGSWRKGIDLFVELAALVREVHPGPVRFAWVGALDDEGATRGRLDQLGVADVVDLPGEVLDPGPWYDRATVFVSTAREDPFPLVALEAGATGLPVLAFDSGGIRELLADGRGTLVGAEDVAALARAVATALERGDGGSGERLRRQVILHHTAPVMAASLWAEVEALRGGSGPPAGDQAPGDETP